MQLESPHTLLTVAAIHDFDIIQFSMTSAYLHRTLKEELFMEQLDSYTVSRKENWVWKLKKGLYRLVQASRTWNKELNSHMESVGYAAMSKDSAVYAKGSWNQEDFMAGSFWVDNFVGIGSRAQLEVLAESVDRKYGITRLGEVKWVLGMLLEHDCTARMISISQEAFINSILAHFNLMDTSPLLTLLIPALNFLPPIAQQPKEKRMRWLLDLIGSSLEH